MSSSDFSELGKYLDEWGLDSAHERLRKRSEATLEESNEFYEAIVPRLEEIIVFLNQFPVDKIPNEYKSLANMALAICEVDDAINLWKSSNLELSSDPYTWRVKSSYYDYI